MKIVSWNMGCAFGAMGYRRHHADAHRWLAEQDADIALLQEVVLDEIPRRDGFECVGVATPDAHGAGTAIVARGTVTPSVPFVMPGATIAVANVIVAGRELRVVSAHVVAENGFEKPNLRAFALRVPEIVRGRPFLVGGDFNASMRWPDYYGWFFEAMAKESLLDTRTERDEVQSYWGGRAKSVIQDDHVFVDADTRKRVIGWAIRGKAEMEQFSDHGPVVVDLAP